MDDCWIFAGQVNPQGYGSISVYLGGGKTTSLKAHRVIYEDMVAPIPKGFVIDHLCRVTSCINPTHMEAVSNKENVLRGFGPVQERARQTHCIRGHKFDNQNTYIRPNGTRWCRKCGNIRTRAGRKARSLASAGQLLANEVSA